MRNLLFSSMGTLKIGMDILTEKEHVTLEKLLGHGGFFKTKGVGQRLMAGALNVPVAVMESAGEGGAWGIALLASYLVNKMGTLEDFLNEKVFAGDVGTTIMPDAKDRAGFERFMERYTAGLAVERAAVDNLKC
jgi:sugar (pentulose or hexulose) kinase